MVDIAYGQSNAPGLPPVDLPTFDNGQQPRTRIVISGPAGGNATGDGGWAPYNAPRPVQAQGVPDQPQQPQQQDQTGGWAQYQPKEQTPPAEVGTGEAALRGAAHGLTFGFEPAIAGAASGISSMLNGGDFSTAYDQTRQQEQQAYEEAQKQHPYVTTAADIAGNIPTMFIPGVGAGKAAMTTAEMLPRIGQAIRTGAVAGGLFGAGEQTSKGTAPLDIAEGLGGGALAGAALGGVFGAGTEGAVNVGRRVGSIVRGQRDPQAEAARLVTGALKQDQKQVMQTAGDKAGLRSAQEAGTDVRLADFGGGTTKALLRTATNLSPEARDIVGETVGPRFEQQATRVGRYIRSRFGAIDSDVGSEAIKAAAAKANDPLYAAAYKAGSQGKGIAGIAASMQGGELQRLAGAPSVQEALFGAVNPLRDRGIIAGYKLPRHNPFVKGENGAISLKTDAKGNPVIPELAFWDQAVRNLNGRIGELLRNGNNTRARDLIQLKNELTDELDKIVPSYKRARATAADFFKANDALEAGANFVHDISISNAKAAQVLAKMSPAERELFRRGFADELAKNISRISDSRNVINSTFVNNGPARQRILLALGQEDAGRLEALLRIEGIVDRTRRALGNSTTMQQGADAGKFAGVLATIEGIKGAVNPAYLVAIPLIWAGRQSAKHIDERVFTEVARLLMSDDPAKLARGLNVAVKNQNVRTALRYASDLSARDLVNLLGPSGVAAGAATLGEHLIGAAKEAPKDHPSDYYDNYQGQIAPP